MNLDDDSDVEQFDRDMDQVSSQAPNPKLLHNQPKPREFSGLKKNEQFKRSDSDDSNGSFGQQIQNNINSKQTRNPRDYNKQTRDGMKNKGMAPDYDSDEEYNRLKKMK